MFEQSITWIALPDLQRLGLWWGGRRRFVERHRLFDRLFPENFRMVDHKRLALFDGVLDENIILASV
jgi:hypothetical protein